MENFIHTLIKNSYWISAHFKDWVHKFINEKEIILMKMNTDQKTLSETF